MKKILWLDGAIVLISFAIGAYFYHLMPQRMAVHWNIAGKVDGFGSRFLGLFVMPIVILMTALIFLAIPKIDPLRANIANFMSYYELLAVFVPIVFFAIYVQTLLWNLGTRVQAIMPVALAALFGLIGVVLQNSKRNWFVGIRTPWTMSSDVVWEKTHKISGKLFAISGVIIFLGVFFPQYQVYLIVVPVVLVALFAVTYSYFIYRAEMKGEAKP